VEGNKSGADLSLELGVKRTLLYRWQDQLERNGDQAFAGKPGPKPATKTDEVARLKKELTEVTEEREILKKAAAYFARDL